MPGGGFRDHPEHINRKGRPKKGNSMADMFRKYMDETKFFTLPDGSKKRMLRMQVFAEAVFAEVLKGNMNAARLIANYHSGLPPFTGKLELTPDEDQEEVSAERLTQLHKEWLASKMGKKKKKGK